MGTESGTGQFSSIRAGTGGKGEELFAAIIKENNHILVSIVL